jgi:hypothetical protein
MHGIRSLRRDDLTAEEFFGITGNASPFSATPTREDFMSHPVTFETIRGNCGLLDSGEREAREESYAWLRGCKPFMTVVYAYRRQKFTVHEVARSLAPGSHTMQTSVMLDLLRKQLDDLPASQ